MSEAVLPTEVVALLGEGPEPTPIEQLKRYIAEGRDWIRDEHRAGRSGLETATLNTELFDRLVQRLFEVAEHGYFERYPHFDQRMSVLAVGGYGRKEMAPYSDLDLLFLHPWKKGTYSEIVSEQMLYTLWDMSLDVGYSHRTVEQCIRLATQEDRVRSSIMDARLVAGASEPAEDLARTIEKRLFGRRADAFVLAKLDELERHHERNGGTLYLLEPNIKEGPGGLRDFHTAGWIARAHFNLASLHDLVLRGLITSAEHAEVEAAVDVLLRMRHEMHYQAERRNDRLTVDVQARIAEPLGYPDPAPEDLDDEEPGVTRMMREYYRNAVVLDRFVRRATRMCTPEPAVRRGLPWRSRKREVADGVWVIGERFLVADAGRLEHEPPALVRVFRMAQALDVEISGATLETIERAVRALDGPLIDCPGVGDEFRAMLAIGERLSPTLQLMHDVGMLEALLPDWGHVTHLVQHNGYHAYTVDHHTLRAVESLQELAPGGEAEVTDRLRRIFERCSKRDVLHFSLLCHDISKGCGGGHSEKGAPVAYAAARRAGFSEEDARLVERVVLLHLYMATFAQRRNLDDPLEIERFCEQVHDLETMELVYLVTYGDMRGTGTNMWTPWKGFLLDDLYRKARIALDSGISALDETRRWPERRGVLAELLERTDGPEAVAFLDEMPPSFFLRSATRWIVRAARLYVQCKHEGIATLFLLSPRGRGYTTLLLAAPDRLGLFRDVAGVLAGHGVSIRGAQLATTDRGLALDTFQVAAGFERADHSTRKRWERVEQDLKAVLVGDRPVDAVAAYAAKSAFRSRWAAPNRVEIDPDSSASATLIDIFANDRIGLVYDIARVLADFGLMIHVAKIATRNVQVTDCFYVTTPEGEKLRDSRRIQELHDAILAVLDEPEERGRSSAAVAEIAISP